MTRIASTSSLLLVPPKTQAQAAADGDYPSAAQRDAPEVETKGIAPDATVALHTAKKPRVETHEEIETSEGDAAGSARKDGPPIAPEAVVATPVPAVSARHLRLLESASPRPAHRRPRVRRHRRRHRLSSLAPSLCKMYGYTAYMRCLAGARRGFFVEDV